MKVISYNYEHPEYHKPHVKIRCGLWPFRKTRNYICISVGFFFADWRCLETGQSVSGSLGNRLYSLLNETGVKAQIEAKAI